MAESNVPLIKVVIVGDSHCRGMDAALKASHPGIHTLSVIQPRGTLAIRESYRLAASSVTFFDPNFIFIHCGHNDLVFHPQHNLHPINSEETRARTLDLAEFIQSNHPNSKTIISALFPRTFTHRSPLPQEEVAAFNRLAKRHGQRLRAQASLLPRPITVSLNMPIWNRISKAEEVHDMFLKDGLHLTDTAKISIAGAWIKIISPNSEVLAPTT